MLKKSPVKRLALHRETLKALEAKELAQVGGGYVTAPASCVNPCNSKQISLCPPIC